MKIAIIAAMDKEVKLLLNIMPAYEEHDAEGLHFFTGEIGDKSVAISKCGIGKVNAAVNTYRLIKHFSPDLVINSGVAGSLDADKKIGDVLVADSVVYHDVWCGPGTLRGAADGFEQKMLPDENAFRTAIHVGGDRNDFHAGMIASGDIFVSDPEIVRQITSYFPEAVGCDMESGAIAQTCAMLGVPFLVVRVLSDCPGSGDNISEYKNFWSEAPEKTFSVLEQLLKTL